MHKPWRVWVDEFAQSEPPQKPQERERERGTETARGALVRTDNLTQAFFSFGVVAPLDIGKCRL